DYFKGNDEVESFRIEGNCCRVSRLKMRLGIVGAREVDRVLRDIDAKGLACVLGEPRCPVAGTASDGESAFVARVSRGEGISREVFGPQIRIDCAWNDAFAGELLHSAGASAGTFDAPSFEFTPIFEFTSIRQGKWNCP